MKHTSEIHQMFVYQSLELMQASFTLSQCVKICQQDCTRDESLTPICRSLKLDKIKLATLRVCSCLETRLERNIESFFTSRKQKKIDCFSVEGYCDHCRTVLEAMGCYYTFCSFQEARPFLTEQDIERGNKKRDMDDIRREYIKEKGYRVEEIWKCDWWESFKTDNLIKNHVRTHFLYK